MGASLRRARLGVEGIPNRTTEHDTRGERPAHRSSPGSDVRSATSVKRCHHHTTRLSSSPNRNKRRADAGARATRSSTRRRFSG